MMRQSTLISAVVLVLFSSVALGNGPGNFKRREFEERYRKILQQYSAGDEAAAVDALMDAEAAVLVPGENRAAQALRKSELAVVERLLPDGGPALQPIIALHEATYLRYKENRQTTLIPHARELVVELIGVFASDADSPQGRVTASRMMTSLAGHLQEAKVDSTASILYRRALNLDETNTVALVGLSFLHEQYGEYSDAARLLETAVTINPKNGAIQLRLGVILVRMGREDAAEEYLREALAEGNPRWMRSVAYQELARILTDRDEIAEARSLLEEGVKAAPDDPNLLIQLAYLSERNGAFSEDPALHRALRHPADSAPIPSPRFIYSQLPREALTELRRQLEKQSDDSLGVLASALVQ